MKKIIISLFIINLLLGCKDEPQYLVKIEGKQLPVTEAIKSNIEIEDIINHGYCNENIVYVLQKELFFYKHN